MEAWIPGQGWTTFDPTPSDPTAVTGGVMSRISLLLDTADQFWQDWVMGYNLERQVVLASRMSESSRSLQLPHFDVGLAPGSSPGSKPRGPDGCRE